MKTKRIYYGPEGHETEMWWDVKVSPAKKAVVVNGNVYHALRGQSGVTVGCAFSNMAVDSNNKSAFPHPVYLASFTKSTALLVDKLKKNGEPAHAVLYAHSYGHITDANDAGVLKKMVQEDPSIIEKSFNLRPPRTRAKIERESPNNTGERSTTRSITRGMASRGAMARAVKAGRLSKNVARQITETVCGAE